MKRSILIALLLCCVAFFAGVKFPGHAPTPEVTGVDMMPDLPIQDIDTVQKEARAMADANIQKQKELEQQQKAADEYRKKKGLPPIDWEHPDPNGYRDLSD